MSKYCLITKKRSIVGNHRSHAMNAVKRKFFPNLHVRRFWVEKENRFIKLRVSTKGIRTIDKKGIENVLSFLKKNIKK